MDVLGLIRLLESRDRAESVSPVPARSSYESVEGRCYGHRSVAIGDRFSAM